MAICWERAVLLAFHLGCFYFSVVLVVRVHAKSTVRHRIDFLNVRNAKNASTLHAQTLVTTNS